MAFYNCDNVKITSGDIFIAKQISGPSPFIGILLSRKRHYSCVIMHNQKQANQWDIENAPIQFLTNDQIEVF